MVVLFMEKKCSKCGELKPLSDFHKDKSNPTGYYSCCKQCKNNYMSKRWKEDDKYRANRKAYSQQSERREYYRKYAEEKRKDPEYREKQKEYMKTYHKDKEDYEKEYRTERYINNRERFLKERRDYTIKNRNNIIHRIVTSQRGRYCKLVPVQHRYNPLLKIIGCSKEEFKEHIESLFDETMSWELFLDNKIHLDHIVPCAYFDLTKEEDQNICFNYRNIQPLHYKDNIKKRNSLPNNHLSIIDNIKVEIKSPS